MGGMLLGCGIILVDPFRNFKGQPRERYPTPREYGVLEYLMRNKDLVVTKADILCNVWDNAHHNGPDNVVEVYMAYVRCRIDVPFGTNTIETIRGVGYRLRP
jgi:two-component system, OmpR family, response regulator